MLLKKKTVNRVALHEIDGKKGLKRTAVSSILVSPFAPVGYIASKDISNSLDAQGLSDEEIYKKTKRRATKIGGIASGISAAAGTIGALSMGLDPATALGAGAVLAGSAGLGTLAVRNSAGVRTKDRLRRRKLANEGIDPDWYDQKQKEIKKYGRPLD